MNDQETFEDALRATLGELARGPAPERLIRLVSAIPSGEPAARTQRARSQLSANRWGSGVALGAAAIVIAIAAILGRPVAAPSTVGGASASAGLLPSPALSGLAAEASPTVSALVASPSPSPSPTASGSLVPARSPVPVGFEPLSATFVSKLDGWVLGSVPCARARCPAIVRTVDGGATWTSVVAPQTTMGGVPGSVQPNGSGISSLRFADPANGWAFGPELWATHDGGGIWARISITGLPGTATITALEASRGTVHAVLYDGAQDFRISSSQVGTDDWHAAAVRVAVGAGPVPEVELVLSGSSGWVLENNRIVVGGAILDGATWRAWQPACLSVVGPAVLAASSTNDLVVVCDVGLWGNPTGEHHFRSTNGGATFAQSSARLALSAAAVTSPNRATIVVAGSDASGASLVGSFDGGRTWSTVLSVRAAAFADLGFTTATQGIVITTTESGAGTLWMTHDGGRTWAAAAF